MLRHINRINDFQAFSGWKKSAATGTFGEVNLVYGQNGSGKSTVASLFALAARGEADAHGLEILVDREDTPGKTRPVTTAADPFWKKVRVFNGEFVRLNLRFDHEGGSEAEALVVLGQTQIDAQERMDGLTMLIDKSNGTLPDWRLKRDAAETAWAKVLSDTARKIVEDLRTLPKYRATNVYSRTQVATVIDGDRKVLDGRSENLITDLGVVQSVNRDEIDYAPYLFPKLDWVAAQLRALTLKTAAGQAIQELKSNPDMSAWAQTGIHLHEERSTCGFCGNPLQESRMEDLKEHFDASARKLQDEAEALVTRLEELEKLAVDEDSRLPELSAFFPELKDPYDIALEVFDTEVKAYVASIGELKKVAKAKVNRLFDSYEAQFPLLAVAPSTAEIVRLVASHNDRSKRFETSREKAGRRVELYRISEATDEYDKQRKASTDYAKLVADTVKTLQKYVGEFTVLSQTSGDAKPLAEQITRDIARLLGRSDLTFELRETDKKYVIRRNGKPATGLSEGEKTAISLLYFLCSLNDEKSKSGLVVIVDDPVSSLDSNILVGASAHLWSELVNKDPTRQVFLMTHNFELFRIWSNLVESKRSSLKSKSVQELRMISVFAPNGTVVRRPLFTDWPHKDNFYRKTRSEYHYLFWKVATALIALRETPDIAAETEAMALIPNAARKMLEGFFAFKYPQHLGDFEGSADAALEGRDEAMKGQIVRFVHHHSHNESGNTGAPIQPGEAIAVIYSVFELMNIVDSSHVAAMCEALGLDVGELLKV